MAKALQLNWQAGELSPRVAQRFDISPYGAGAERLINVAPTLEGALVRAPGTEKIATLTPDTQSRMALFKRSEEQSYILLFEHHSLRIFDANTRKAVAVDGAGEFVLATPWPDDRLDLLTWTQSVSVMILTHKSNNYPYQVLTLFSDGTWGLKEYRTILGPYLPLNFDEDLRLTVSGLFDDPDDDSDFLTITASEAFFTSGMEGGLLRLFDDNYGYPYEAWQAEEEVRSGRELQNGGRIYLVTTVNDDQVALSRYPPSHEQGTVRVFDKAKPNADNIDLTYLHDGATAVRIKEVVSETEARICLDPNFGNRIPTRNADAPGSNGFQIGAFSNEHGWPGLVGIFQQRLTFMATREQPDTFFMSFSQGYNPDEADFLPNRGNGEVTDEHAITRTLADGEINLPAWMVADDRLIVGMANRLVVISGPTIDEPITPAGASARRIPGVPGSSYRCIGILLDTVIAWASKAGRKLYVLHPDGSYNELTELARHVGHVDIVELIWNGEPHQRLYVRRDDGTVYCVVYERQQGVTAFFQYRPAPGAAGDVIIESMVNAPERFGLDRMYFVTRRTINGATVRTLELLANDWNPDTFEQHEACHVSAGVRYDGTHVDGASVRLGNDPSADIRRYDEIAITLSEPVPALAADTIIELVARTPDVNESGEPVISVARVKVQLVTVNGTDATGIALADVPAALAGIDVAEWAICTLEIIGLDHLENEDVYLQGDGAWQSYLDENGTAQTRYRVTGGRISLDEPIAHGWAGLPMEWLARGVKLLGVLDSGQTYFDSIKIREVMVNLAYAGPGELFARVLTDEHSGHEEEVAARTARDPVDQAVMIRERTYRQTLSAARGCNSQVVLRGDGVLPAEIYSMGVMWDRE